MLSVLTQSLDLLSLWERFIIFLGKILDIMAKNLDSWPRCTRSWHGQDCQDHGQAIDVIFFAGLPYKCLSVVRLERRRIRRYSKRNFSSGPLMRGRVIC